MAFGGTEVASDAILREPGNQSLAHTPETARRRGWVLPIRPRGPIHIGPVREVAGGLQKAALPAHVNHCAVPADAAAGRYDLGLPVHFVARDGPCKCKSSLLTQRQHLLSLRMRLGWLIEQVGLET